MQQSFLAPAPRGGVPLERLPTNTTSNAYPVHRWFNFIAGYSPAFVARCCHDLDASRGDRLLDPFAGCATSLVAARGLGLASAGYEPHPVFARIARAKAGAGPSLQHLAGIEACLLDGLSRPQPADALPEAPRAFLAKLFPPDSLGRLLGARAALEAGGLAGDDLAFLILSRVLELSSHSQTDGIYKAPTTLKRHTPPDRAAGRVVAEVRADLVAMPRHELGVPVELHERSSERMPEVESGSVSIVVTSPPYLNNFDYAEMTRMHLYFWGMAASWGEITDKVRSRLIVNTTTALNGHKSRQEFYKDSLPADLRTDVEIIVDELKRERSVRPGKKEYDFIVYPYLHQMREVLAETWRCLRVGGRIHMMVADAALYGVHIATPQMLAALMETVGFREVRCELVRQRGHRWVLSKRDGSKRGLGEYHVHGSK